MHKNIINNHFLLYKYLSPNWHATAINQYFRLQDTITWLQVNGAFGHVATEILIDKNIIHNKKKCRNNSLPKIIDRMNEMKAHVQKKHIRYKLIQSRVKGNTISTCWLTATTFKNVGIIKKNIVTIIIWQCCQFLSYSKLVDEITIFFSFYI